MASAVRDHERRLRGLFRALIGTALAAGQIALPFACGSGSGSGSAGPTTGSGRRRRRSRRRRQAAGGDGRDSGTGGDFDGDARPTCDPTPFIPDGAHDCEKFVHLACGLPKSASLYQDCYLGVNDCTAACGGPAFNCQVTGDACVDGAVLDRTPEGGLDLECAVCLGADGSVGRVPAGLRRGRGARGQGGGAARAAAAELEAARGHAFARLAIELELHGAPRPLVSAAKRARTDESRHARSVARLARRFDGAPRRARVRAVTPSRSLEAIAIENAVEGCVREAYGALLATFQAAHAEDAEARRVYTTIAAEETRHAALAAAVHAWALSRLGLAARRRVAAAHRVAIASLANDPAPSPPNAAAIGWPGRDQRRRLARAFAVSLRG